MDRDSAPGRTVRSRRVAGGSTAPPWAGPPPCRRRTPASCRRSPSETASSLDLSPSRPALPAPTSRSAERRIPAEPSEAAFSFRPVLLPAPLRAPALPAGLPELPAESLAAVVFVRVFVAFRYLLSSPLAYRLLANASIRQGSRYARPRMRLASSSLRNMRLAGSQVSLRFNCAAIQAQCEVTWVAAVTSAFARGGV